MVIIDKVLSFKKYLAFKNFIHLSPSFNSFNKSRNLTFQYFFNKSEKKVISDYKQGYLAKGYGKREKRKVIENKGNISKGNFAMVTIISNNKLDSSNKFISENSGEINFKNQGKILWDIKNDFFSIKDY